MYYNTVFIVFSIGFPLNAGRRRSDYDNGRVIDGECSVRVNRQRAGRFFLMLAYYRNTPVATTGSDRSMAAVALRSGVLIIILYLN